MEVEGIFRKSVTAIYVTPTVPTITKATYKGVDTNVKTVTVV